MFPLIDQLDDGWQSWQKLYDGWIDVRDRRVDSWPLMSSCLPTLSLVAVYLSVVRYGPVLMRGRPPLQLRAPLLVYNILVAALNLYIGIELASVIISERYNWLCQPVDYSSSAAALRVASALWCYYMSKLLEFVDTLLFVLRKKQSQLTFLHVYHHATMFMLWWIGVKWVPGGSGAIGAMVNSFVHVIMYTYYGLSSLGPTLRRYLWWKRYLTLLQMAQFCLNFGLGSVALRVGCDFPLWMQYANLAYMVSFMLLFSRFYFGTYRKKSVIASVSSNGNSVSSYSTLSGVINRHSVKSNGHLSVKKTS